MSVSGGASAKGEAILSLKEFGKSVQDTLNFQFGNALSASKGIQTYFSKIGGVIKATTGQAKDYTDAISETNKTLDDLINTSKKATHQLRQLGFTFLIGMFGAQNMAKIMDKLGEGFTNLVKQYDPFQSAMWSLEDTAVKPFEKLEDFASTLADSIDRLPEPIRDSIGYLQMFSWIGGRILDVFSGVMQVLTFKYSVIPALKALRDEITGLNKNLTEFYLKQFKLKEALLVLKSGGRYKSTEDYLTQQNKAMDKMLETRKESPLEKVKDSIVQMKNVFKKPTQGIKKFLGEFKTNRKAVTEVVGGLVGMFGISLLLGPAMDALSPILESMINAFTDLLAPIQPYIDMMADFLDQNPAIAAALGTLTIAIGVLIAAMGLFGTTAIATALSSAGAAIASFATGAVGSIGTVLAAIGPIGWAIAAIGIAIGLFALAWSQDWGGIRESFASAGNAISKGWTDLVVTLGNAWDGFAKWIKSGIDTIVGFFQPLIDIISYISKALGIDNAGFKGNQMTINNTIVSVSGEIPQQLLDALTHIPKAQTGGVIGRSGLAYVDAAELIVPKGSKSSTDVEQTVNIEFNVTGARDQDVVELSRKISVELRKQLNSLAGGGI